MIDQRHGRSTAPNNSDRPLERTEVRRLGIVAMLAAALSLLLIGATTALSASGGMGITATQVNVTKVNKRYAKLWEDVRPKDKRWARSTSACESGGSRSIHGGGGSFHGAFQFMLSTWRAAPRSPGGDPHAYSWKTQAVVAVALMRRDGAGHWPNCG